MRGARALGRMMDLHWFASAFAVAAGVVAFARWGRRLLRNVSRSAVPTDTLRFVPLEVRWWIYQTAGTKRAELDAALNVTNITSQPIRILKASLKRPKVDADGFVKMASGSFDVVVEPGDTKGILVNFQWPADILKEKTVEAVIVLVDQFANEHALRSSAPFEMPSWRKFLEESKQAEAARTKDAGQAEELSQPPDSSSIH